MDELFDNKGIVSLFDYGSLDASEPFLDTSKNYDNSVILANYDGRFKAYLIGALDVFRQTEIFIPSDEILEFQYLVEQVQKQLMQEVTLEDAIDILGESSEGVIMGTIEDICEGVACGMAKYHAGAIASLSGENLVDDITIKKDGSFVPDKSGSASGQVSLGTSERQQRNGQSVALLVGLKNWLADLQQYHDDYTGDIATATLFMRTKYDLYDTFDTTYQNYYNYRLVPNGQLATFADILEELLYCGAMSIPDVVDWIIDSYTGDKVLLISLVQTISPIQWTIWLTQNIKPVDDYLSYGCTLRPPYELRLTSALWLSGGEFGVTLSPAWVINQNVRYARIELEGSIGIDALNYHDGIYNWVDGIPNYAPIGIGGRSNYSGSFVAWGAKALNPFDMLRDYTIQVPITGTATSWYQGAIKRNIALPSWSDGSEVGSFKVVVTDLGSIG